MMQTISSCFANIICKNCEVFLKTDGKTTQIYDKYGNARRVNVYKCPKCGFEVYSGMSKVFDVSNSEYKGDKLMSRSVE